MVWRSGLGLSAKSICVGSYLTVDCFRFEMDDVHFHKVELTGGNYKSRQTLIDLIIKVAASRGIPKKDFSIRVTQHRAIFRKCSGAVATISSAQQVVAGIIHDELLKCGELHAKTELLKANIDVDRCAKFGEPRDDIEERRQKQFEKFKAEVKNTQKDKKLRKAAKKRRQDKKLKTESCLE